MSLRAQVERLEHCFVASRKRIPKALHMIYEDSKKTAPAPFTGLELVNVALAFLVGLIVRVLFCLQVPGLWYDEAINGLDALSILREPGIPIFFDTNGHMREPLYMYMEVLGVLAGGTTAEALRMVSVITGTLTIPAVWLLAREIRGVLFAAISVWIFSLLRWHIHFSGLAFRTILAPLFASLVFFFFFRFHRREKLSDAIPAGVFLGLGAYTYLAFRLFPIIMLISMIAGLVIHQEKRKRLAKGYLTMIATAFIVFLPLGLNYLNNPEHFKGRVDEATLFEREDAANRLLKQAFDITMMPLFRGDHVEKHNIPGPPQAFQFSFTNEEETVMAWFTEGLEANKQGLPQYDRHGTGLPVVFLTTGLLFYLGLIVSFLIPERKFLTICLISWLVIGSLASLLSFGAPNMLRLLMIVPVFTFFIVEGALVLWKWISKKSMVAAKAIFTFVFLIHVIAELYLAFSWSTHPLVPKGFNSEWRDLATYLKEQDDRLPVNLSFAPSQTLLFLADDYEFIVNSVPNTELYWELRPNPQLGLTPLETRGQFQRGGRSFEVIHPDGFIVGTLVEVHRSEN